MLKNLNIGIISNIITILLGLLALGTFVESKIEEISISQTTIIAGIIATDLRTRLNLYESYVLELERNNKNVPSLLIYNIKSLNDQLEDLKEWGHD